MITTPGRAQGAASPPPARAARGRPPRPGSCWRGWARLGEAGRGVTSSTRVTAPDGAQRTVCPVYPVCPGYSRLRQDEKSLICSMAVWAAPNYHPIQLLLQPSKFLLVIKKPGAGAGAVLPVAVVVAHPFFVTTKKSPAAIPAAAGAAPLSSQYQNVI